MTEKKVDSTENDTVEKLHEMNVAGTVVFDGSTLEWAHGFHK